MKFKKTDLRLAPRGVSTYLKHHHSLYEDLKAGKVITIPEKESSEFLASFGACVEIVTEKVKDKSTLSKSTEGDMSNDN
jgi:hypothetical protein